jgi:copper transport protein
VSSLVAAVAAVLVLAAAPPAAAHASLVDTDPDEGAVLETAPQVIRFAFDEPVRGVPGGVQVFDAAGQGIASSSLTRDKQLLVTLDQRVADGTLVVTWRVVSEDGHPLAGTLTFSVGAPSPGVRPPGAAGTHVPVALSIARWPAYAGLLLAVGLVWFSAFVLPLDRRRLERAGLRVRETARGAAGVAVVAWLVGLPLTGAYLRGTGVGTVFEAATWQALPTDEVVLTLTCVAALVASVALLPVVPADVTRPVLAAVAGFLALAPLPLSGHTRAIADAELVVAVDAVHLVAGATWLGGLVGLAFTLGALPARPEAAAAIVGRFSSMAAATLAALVLSGAFLAWRLVGSWGELFASDYGRVLVLKIGLAAVAVAIAGYNRFRLVPRIHTSSGFQDTMVLSRLLARTARAEAGALVAVLLVTGFLVHNNPPASGVSDVAPVAQIRRTSLAELQAVVTLDPAAAGMNTLTLEVIDADSQPTDGTEPPKVGITSGKLGGDVPLERVATGIYRGRVVIPRRGEWEVQMSLRLGTFENPVAGVAFDVR